MCERGISARELQYERYDIDISPGVASAVTDAVPDGVAEWEKRPLEAVYALVALDALRVKVREMGTACNKAVYVAIGIRLTVPGDILGLWVEQTEGAKSWLRAMNDLRERSLHGPSLVTRKRTTTLRTARPDVGPISNRRCPGTNGT